MVYHELVDVGVKSFQEGTALATWLDALQPEEKMRLLQRCPETEAKIEKYTEVQQRFHACATPSLTCRDTWIHHCHVCCRKETPHKRLWVSSMPMKTRGSSRGVAHATGCVWVLFLLQTMCVCVQMGNLLLMRVVSSLVSQQHRNTSPYGNEG